MVKKDQRILPILYAHLSKVLTITLDVECTFEGGLCQWEALKPEIDFSWKRRSGQDLVASDIPGPGRHLLYKLYKKLLHFC